MVKKRKLKATPNQKNFNIHPSEPKSTEEQHPIFSLTNMVNDKYGLNNCQQVEKAAFVDTLYKLSRVTWAQINVSGRHGLGIEVIKQESIKASIPKNITNDTNIIAFRFYGKAPMVGYRDGRVFYVIWLDRNYTLYDH